MLAIIIPYFKLAFFEKTLKSLENQSDKRFTVYVGDDSSPEDCFSIIESYKKKNILVYHRFESNLGAISLTKQWHRCVELSEDEKWLMLLGDDDVLGENVVHEFYKFIESNSEAELIRLDLRVIDQNDNIISQAIKHKEHESSEELLDRMLSMNETITGSEFIFSRDVYNRNNGFVEFPLAWFSDYATWLLFSKNKGVFYVKNATTYWRLSGCNISSAVMNENNIRMKIKSLFMFMYFVQNNYNIENKRLKNYTHSQIIIFFGNISDFLKIKILRKELFKFRYRLADIVIFQFIFGRLKRKKIKNLWKYLFRIRT